MRHELTIQSSTSDYLAALSADARIAKAEADAAQKAFDAALTTLMREHGIAPGPIADLRLDGPSLSFEMPEAE